MQIAGRSSNRRKVNKEKKEKEEGGIEYYYIAGPMSHYNIILKEQGYNNIML